MLKDKLVLKGHLRIPLGATKPLTRFTTKRGEVSIWWGYGFKGWVRIEHKPILTFSIAIPILNGYNDEFFLSWYIGKTPKDIYPPLVERDSIVNYLKLNNQLVPKIDVALTCIAPPHLFFAIIPYGWPIISLPQEFTDESYPLLIIPINSLMDLSYYVVRLLFI